jgi:hypothetical protein
LLNPALPSANRISDGFALESTKLSTDAGPVGALIRRDVRICGIEVPGGRENFMSKPEEKPEEEAATSLLDDSTSESAAALSAYLSGSGSASPFRSASLDNRTKPARPIIVPPERHVSNERVSLATYLAATLLIVIAVREAVLVVKSVTTAKATISKRGEPTNLKMGGRIPPPALSEDKTPGQLTPASTGRGAAAIASSVSSQSAGYKEAQSRGARPAQPVQAENKPWSETVKAFKKLFTEQSASQADRWKPTVVAGAIPPASEKQEPGDIP